MRLPGANYAYGVKSLGRVGDEAAGVYRAAADYELVKGNAQGEVIKAFQGSVDAYNAWDEATQTANANKALADYNTKMAARETELRNTEAFKTADIPDTVKVEREKNGEPVEWVPNWQVAPQLYDMSEREAADHALAQVTNPKIRQQLQVNLQNRRTESSTRVAEDYFKARKDSIRNTTIEALQGAVLAEDTALGDKILQDAVETGIFSLDEARKERTTMMQGADKIKAERLIMNSEDPAQLSAFAASIGQPGPNAAFPHLPPDERLRLQVAAEGRSNSITNQRLAEYDRAKSDAAANTFNNVLERFTLTGQPATEEEIAQAKKYMTPTQFKSFVSIGRTGGQASTPSDRGTLQNANTFISQLTDTGDGGNYNLDAKIQFGRQYLEQEFAAGRLNATDFKDQMALVEATEKRVFESDQFKAGAGLLADGIVPHKGVPGMPVSKVDTVIEAQAQIDLRAAVAKDPKLDPVRWAQENLPRYQAQVNDKLTRDLHKFGISTLVKAQPDGMVDKVQTKAAIEAAFKSGTITKEAAINAVNAIEGGTP